jgi:iron complex transport system substrate-binding protein
MRHRLSRTRRRSYPWVVRIVSLLPSTTEILFAVGAGDDVIGVTFECDFPPEARSRRIVSGTTLPAGLTPAGIDAEVKARVAAGEELYHLDEGALRELDPDIVVTQDLCAVCAVDVANVDEALVHLGCRAEVTTVDPMTLEDVLASIMLLGKITGNEQRAGRLVDSLRDRLAIVAAAVDKRPRPRVAMLEWTEPLFCAGHWVPDLVSAAGAISVLGPSGQRSHPIVTAEVARADPDLIVVAPCGYRLDGAVELASGLHRSGLLPSTVEVWAVDADATFVRPGPRVVDGVETLAGIAHPDVLSIPPGAATRIASR